MINFKKEFPKSTGWWTYLKDEFDKDYMLDLENFLNEEKKTDREIFPPQKEIFEAFKLTKFSDIKVVIIGQDPYHGDGQAHGLLFSVLPDVKIPPSLRNIYKEMNEDIGFRIPNHGNLNAWAKQGVLLLNSILTVERRKAASHRKKGWETFTDRVIDLISKNHESVVFVLWGNFAKVKGRNIDKSKHFVLEGNHPSPLSAYRGFFGCGHFGKINKFVRDKGDNINWDL